jgi:hypothetical protein
LYCNWQSCEYIRCYGLQWWTTQHNNIQRNVYALWFLLNLMTTDIQRAQFQSTHESKNNKTFSHLTSNPVTGWGLMIAVWRRHTTVLVFSNLRSSWMMHIAFQSPNRPCSDLTLDNTNVLMLTRALFCMISFYFGSFCPAGIWCESLGPALSTPLTDTSTCQAWGYCLCHHTASSRHHSILLYFSICCININYFIHIYFHQNAARDCYSHWALQLCSNKNRTHRVYTALRLRIQLPIIKRNIKI